MYYILYPFHREQQLAFISWQINKSSVKFHFKIVIVVVVFVIVAVAVAIVFGFFVAVTSIPHFEVCHNLVWHRRRVLLLELLSTFELFC